MVAIVILNWNGWQDTIECVKSIQLVECVDCCTVIVDNGSTDSSVGQITEFFQQKKIRFFSICEGEVLQDSILSKDVVLYKLKQNYGFAKGNNLGIKLLLGQKVDYYWILNNDTVVDKKSLKILNDFMDVNKRYYACTPQIRYFTPNNRIWNCGGRLFFGLRKNYFNNQDDVEFKKEYFDISYVTGCALFIRPDILNNGGKLFTEQFFFGEEDFEFSLRMKEQKKLMACCVRSIIYHKVSASINKKPKLSAIYIHYLNRYINIRQHFSISKFFFWRVVNNIYLKRQLVKHRYKAETIKKFVSRLNSECFLYEGVSKEMFDNIRISEDN